MRTRSWCIFAVLAALSFAAAIPATAQTTGPPLRLTRRPAWTPDSTVRAVFEGGSASVTPNPVVDVGIPRLWLTKAERTGWKQTADYDEVLRYCRQLEGGSRWVKLEMFGRTGQGRELPLLIVSKERLFTPEAARASGKPVILIQNGIHSGEIEGKDASLMLVRDLAVLRKHPELLDSVVVLVVPMFSADAHERRSRYNRINQNGPDEMGWRHTPAGYNLNRDYMKVDSPEMKALLGNVYTKWWPELLVDDHTTDGADYRHDVTWSFPHGPDAPPSIERWCMDAIEGRIGPRLVAMGHLPAPYLSLRGRDPREGIDFEGSTPRFSTGYPPLHGRAALLVETHMLKPYGSRVQATYDLLLALLEEVNARPRALTSAVREAEAAAIARGASRGSLVLATKLTDKSVPFAFKGVVTNWDKSDITGTMVPRYTSAPWDTVVPLFREMAPVLTVRQPAGYLVPQEWNEVISRLDLHGLRYRRLSRAWSDSVEMSRITDWSVAPQAFENRHLVTVKAYRAERGVRSFRAGDVWVPLDQRSGALAVNLFEVQAPDALMSWGFFETIFQKKEYGEDYVVEPLAREMMRRDPKLEAEFRAKVAADTSFAKDPGARIDFFYRRSPWADPEQDLYPIARVLRRPPEDALVPDPRAPRPLIDTPIERPRR